MVVVETIKIKTPSETISIDVDTYAVLLEAFKLTQYTVLNTEHPSHTDENKPVTHRHVLAEEKDLVISLDYAPRRIPLQVKIVEG